jgi:hypothetical protein
VLKESKEVLVSGLREWDFHLLTTVGYIFSVCFTKSNLELLERTRSYGIQAVSAKLATPESSLLQNLFLSIYSLALLLLMALFNA